MVITIGCKNYSYNSCIKYATYACNCSYVEDYAKWQLLVNAYSFYTAPLPDSSLKILQDVKFPKTSKLSEDAKLTCVEGLEIFMPFAVARPFVDEFITDSMRVKVCNFLQAKCINM